MPRPQARGEFAQGRVLVEAPRIRHEHQLHQPSRPLDAQLQVPESAAVGGLVVRRELAQTRELAADGCDHLVDRRMVRHVALLVAQAWHHLMRARAKHTDERAALWTRAHCDARRRPRARAGDVLTTELETAGCKKALRFGEDWRQAAAAEEAPPAARPPARPRASSQRQRQRQRQQSRHDEIKVFFSNTPKHIRSGKDVSPALHRNTCTIELFTNHLNLFGGWLSHSPPTCKRCAQS